MLKSSREDEKEEGWEAGNDKQDALSTSGGNGFVATSSLFTSINVDCDQP